MGRTYNIYCDESCHLEHDNSNVMVLGCVWCPIEKKDEIFTRLREIKVRNGLKPTCELKWNAVSNSKLSYYIDVLDYFFDMSDIHFRALVVQNKQNLRHAEYRQTHDEFYYKMYFDMLKTILTPQEFYNIYIDIKDTQGVDKVEKLKEYLCNNVYDYDKHMIKRIQQVRSHEVELIELADFMIGAVCYRNRGLDDNKAKIQIIERLMQKSGYSLIRSTLYKEDKVNIFIWKGGYGHVGAN
ncbi:MAG: DUF3800 domain-containing protein [Bacteroidales bacterium]|nr:DUF3800 domain-containing protein [Bacteroidales bacterium]